jgi:hypothetical protein
MQRFLRKFKLRAPNGGYQPGGGGCFVHPGDFVVYVEEYIDGTKGRALARVLDRPLQDPGGNRLPKDTVMLRVLYLGTSLDFGYVRYVDLNDIIEARPANAFMTFFVGELPDGDLVQRMSEGGYLNARAMADRSWERHELGRAERRAEDEARDRAKAGT